MNKWQKRWESKNDENLHEKQKPIKLFEITPILGPFELKGLTRKDEVVIHRIRIGHTRLTHKYLMEDRYRREPPCNYCYLDTLSVKHLLIECQHFANIRSKHYTATDMKNLFEKFSVRKIISFLKESNLYNQI